MIRIAAVQYELKAVAHFEEFASRCRYFVETASDFGAQFVLFPEMFSNELMALSPGIEPAAAVRALDAHTPAFLATLGELARRHKLTIIGGSHFTVEGDKIFNVSHVFFADGRVGKQYKLHVTPSEKRAWGIDAGTEVEVFEAAGVKFAVQICYDVEFPEMTRHAVEKGARIVFVPFCTDDRQGFWRVRHCAQARCIENQIYVVTAGVVGNLRGVRNMDVHFGQAAILTPCDYGFARDGIAAEAPLNSEFLLVQDVDPARLESARDHGTVRNWNDRRTDLYTVAWQPSKAERPV